MKKVLDNFLSQQHYHELVEHVNNHEWYYNPMIVYDKSNMNPEDQGYAGPDTPDDYQMVMPIWRDGWIHDRFIVEIFSYYLNPSAWVRIKANFSPKRNKLIENELHIDANFRDMTGLFYVN